MSINYIDSRGGKNHLVNLPVLVSDLTVTVKAGSLRFSEEDLVLVEDQEFTVTPDPDETLIIDAVLAKIRETEEVLLVVDELLPGEDEFDFTSSPYERLHAYCWFEVPPAAVDLSGVEIQVHRLLADDAFAEEDEE